MTSAERWLAEELEKLKLSIQAKGSTPQLGHSAIHDGKVDEYRGDSLVQRIGKQVDGTNTTVQFNGPPPPAPSKPVVELLDLGARVKWDGTWADGAVAPLDLARIDVHIVTAVDTDPLTTPSISTISAAGWGDASLPLLPDDYWAVLVAWSTSGQYAVSPVSDPFTIAPFEVDLSGVPHTYVQDDAPVAAMENDFWVDTSTEARIVYYWDGDSWEQASKIIAGSITANEIAAGAITGNEIAAGSITADKLVADFVTALEISANQITSGEIQSNVGLLAILRAGGFVEIDGASSSITIYADVDHLQPLVQLRPEGSVFRGRVEADDISVLNGLILIGESSQLASGAIMTLMSGVADPQSAPTVSFTTIGSAWPTVPAGFIERGISWDAIDDCWIRLLVSTAVDIAGLCRVQRISAAGAVLGHTTLGNVAGIGEDDLNSIVHVGAYYYSVITHSADARRRVGRWEASGGAYSAMSLPMQPNLWVGRTAVGRSVDGNLVHAGILEQGGVRGVAWEIIDPDDMSIGFLRHNYDGGYDPTWSTNVMYAGMDEYSFPEAHIQIVAGQTARAFTYTDVMSGTAPAYDTDFAFDTGGSVAAGGATLHPDGTWYSVISNQQLQRYSNWLPDTGEGLVHAAYVNTDGSYHTAPSPIGESLALHRRRFAVVTPGQAPAGVTGSTVYALVSPTTPDIEDLLGRPESVVNGSLIFDPSVAGSGAPPATSTFPGGVPSVLRTANDKFRVEGDGSGDWRQLSRYTGNTCEKTANQAITSRTPTTAWTDVTWIDPSTDRGRGLITWDTATDSFVNSGTESIIVGVRARVAFAGHATGARWLSVKKITSGAVTSYMRSDTKQTGNTGVVVLEVDTRLRMDVGDKLSVVAAQNSGADLDILGALTSSAGSPNEFEIEFKGYANA